MRTAWTHVSVLWTVMCLVAGTGSARAEEPSPLMVEVSALREAGDHEGALSVALEAASRAEAELGPDDSSVADALEIAARVQFAGLRDLNAAEALLRRVVRIREASSADDLRLAITLTRLSEVLKKKKHFRAAADIHARVIAIKEGILGEDHLDVAKGLEFQGRLEELLSNYPAARSLYERSLEIHSAHLDATDERVWLLQNSLGGLFQKTGDLKESESMMRQALANREAALGPRHEGVAIGLNNLASVLHELDAFDEARALFERSLSIREELHGASHPMVATVHNNLGMLLTDMGAYGDAQEALQRAVDIRRHELGTEHPLLATSINNLAIVYYKTGELEVAAELFEQSLSIRLRVYGDEHPSIVSAMTNLGAVRMRLGEYERARQLLQMALQSTEERLGPEDPSLAGILNLQAVRLRRLGDFEGAIPLYERALRIRERALGPDHSEVASVVHNLGVVHQMLGHTEEALAHFQRALVSTRARLGDDHPSVGTSLGVIAMVHDERGDSAEAQRLSEEALRITEAAFGPESLEVATRLNSLGLCLAHQGQYRAALPLYQRSLRLEEDEFGHNHYNLVPVLRNLAGLRALMGQHGKARRLHTRSLDIVSQRLDLLGSLREPEAFVHMGEIRRSLDAWLGAHIDRSADQEAWQHVLRWKGAIAGRQKVQRLASHADPTLQDLTAAWSRARIELAQAYFEEDRQRDPDGPARVAAAKAKADVLEDQLRSSSTFVDASLSVARTDARAICASLDSDTVLVDFFRYRASEAEEHYTAFLLDGGSCRVDRVELGDAGAIDAALASWVTSTASVQAPAARSQPLLSYAGSPKQPADAVRLEDLIWSPLANAMRRQPGSLIVVPDSGLTKLPFAALSNGRGGFLLEDLRIHYLHHAGDLVRFGIEDGIGDGALVVGGLDFNAADHPISPSDDVGIADLRGSDTPCVSRAWTALPGTLEEVEAVRGYWSTYGDGSRVEVLTGPNGTEGSLRRAMEGRRLIHVGTHGFSQTGGRCPSRLEGTGTTDTIRCCSRAWCWLEPTTPTRSRRSKTACSPLPRSLCSICQGSISSSCRRVTRGWGKSRRGKGYSGCSEHSRLRASEACS